MTDSLTKWALLHPKPVIATLGISTLFMGLGRYIEKELDAGIKGRSNIHDLYKLVVALTTFRSPLYRKSFDQAFCSFAKSRSISRLKRGKPRSIWGVTPILTLPLLAKADRLNGFEAYSLVFETYHIETDFDINLESLKNQFFEKYPDKLNGFYWAVFCWSMLRFDVFNYFNDRGILPPSKTYGIQEDELQLLNEAGKRIYTYAYGADFRTKSRTLELGEINICMDCPKEGLHCICDDQQAKEAFAPIYKYVTALCSMADAHLYVPNAMQTFYWPVDTEKLAKIQSHIRNDDFFLVAHSSNHALLKGSGYIEETIAKLKNDGLNIELDVINGVSNQEALQRYKSADIVIEQLISGYHGYTALEAMALGKPVISHIKNKKHLLAGEACPVIDATPQNLAEVIRELYENRSKLEEIGKAGFDYIHTHYTLVEFSNRQAELYLTTGRFPSATRLMFSEKLRARNQNFQFEENALKEKIRKYFKLPIIGNVLFFLIDISEFAKAKETSFAKVLRLLFRFPIATLLKIRNRPRLREYVLTRKILDECKAGPSVKTNNPNSREICMLVLEDICRDPRVQRGARALSDAGYYVHVLYPIEAISDSSLIPDYGPNIVFEPMPPGSASYAGRFPYSISEVLLHAALKRKPFAYHCHDLSTCLAGLIAAQRNGAHCVADFHEWYSENVTYSDFFEKWRKHSKVKTQIYRELEALMMAKCSGVIAVTQSEVNEIEAQYATGMKVTLVKNQPDIVVSKESYEDLSDQLYLPKGTRILLWQGGLGPTRLLEPIIEAMPYVKDAVLVIRGPGYEAYKETYLRIAQKFDVLDRVFCMPPVPSDHVVIAAKSATIGIWSLPNLARNFYLALGNKVFEYMSADLPVIGAYYPEFQRIVDENGVGFSFDPYDPQSIAQAANRLLEDDETYKNCQNAAIECARKYGNMSDWSRMVKLYDSFSSNRAK